MFRIPEKSVSSFSLFLKYQSSKNRIKEERSKSTRLFSTDLFRKHAIFTGGVVHCKYRNCIADRTFSAGMTHWAIFDFLPIYSAAIPHTVSLRHTLFFRVDTLVIHHFEHQLLNQLVPQIEIGKPQIVHFKGIVL